MDELWFLVAEVSCCRQSKSSDSRRVATARKASCSSEKPSPRFSLSFSLSWGLNAVQSAVRGG